MRMNKLLLVPLYWLPLAVQAACPALLNQQLPGLMGGTVDLCQYADRPVLVVNTASHCGFTPQFTKLEALYKRYRDRGFVIVGVPSNDFHQELERNSDIGKFCLANYGVSFPMATKAHVVGPDAIPLYRQLITVSGDAPRWNFHKYLIAPGGATVTSYGTRTEPDDPKLIGQIEGYLNGMSAPAPSVPPPAPPRLRAIGGS